MGRETERESYSRVLSLLKDDGRTINMSQRRDLSLLQKMISYSMLNQFPSQFSLILSCISGPASSRCSYLSSSMIYGGGIPKVSAKQVIIVPTIIVQRVKVKTIDMPFFSQKVII